MLSQRRCTNSNLCAVHLRRWGRGRCDRRERARRSRDLGLGASVIASDYVSVSALRIVEEQMDVRAVSNRLSTTHSNRIDANPERRARPVCVRRSRWVHGIWRGGDGRVDARECWVQIADDRC
jgi:hypothetical protein